MRRSDHPRSRGVYLSCTSQSSPTAGSSPLARGLREGTAAWGPEMGIIPARAGFTMALTARPMLRRDHPRSRGVYNSGAPPAEWNEGSSPLARGLRAGVSLGLGELGIIPARAGFTRSAPR